MDTQRPTPSSNGKLQNKPAKSHHLKQHPIMTPCNLEAIRTITADDTELSIFDAQRYFSEVSTEPKDFIGLKGQKSTIMATPISSSSEASCNTESFLLSPKLQSSPTIKIKAFSWSNLIKLFGHKCLCLGKKSVEVEEKRYSEPKSLVQSNYNSSGYLTAAKQLNSKTVTDNGLSSIPERGTSMELEGKFDVEKVTTMTIIAGKWDKDRSNFLNCFSKFNHYSFPVLQQLSYKLDELPRESLEVFQPTEDSPEVQRRALILPISGENYSKRFDFLANPKLISDEDVASDTSSDLFEIENFSTFRGACPRRDSHELEGFENFNMVNFSTTDSNFDGFRFTQTKVSPKDNGILDSVVKIQ